MVCLTIIVITVAVVLTLSSGKISIGKEERKAVAGQATALRHHEGLLNRQAYGGHAQDAQV